MNTCKPHWCVVIHPFRIVLIHHGFEDFHFDRDAFCLSWTWRGSSRTSWKSPGRQETTASHLHQKRGRRRTKATCQGGEGISTGTTCQMYSTESIAGDLRCSEWDFDVQYAARETGCDFFLFFLLVFLRLLSFFFFDFLGMQFSKVVKHFFKGIPFIVPVLGDGFNFFQRFAVFGKANLSLSPIWE